MAQPPDDTDSPVGSSEGMVDNLVTQFSSALDCFRELVQNSIDAGTPRVDIWMEWEPGEGHEGTIAIHVEDFGEGMDEQIIDDELTRLFASGKDEDLTKIGKFGIGFVSVFALEPRAVLVHTGRSGEYWEVLFHEDRSFSKTRVDNPVEGTQITIFLEDEYHRYQQLAEEIPETLRHWCSHSAVEVSFEDRFNNDDFAPPETINEPFEVDGQCLQQVDHEGTQIVLAYNRRPIYGFYNRGLTLSLTDVGDDVLGRWKDRFEFISFKIKSRYLEHTLARDSVIRDEQFERAMRLLEEAANGPLLDGLLSELEQLAGDDDWGVQQYHRYGRLMDFAATEPIEQIAEHADRPILRSVNAPAMTLAEAWEVFQQENRLLLAGESTSLTDHLAEADIPVLLGQSPRRVTGDQLRAVARLLTRFLNFQAERPVRGFLWRAKTAIGRMFDSDTGATAEGPTKQQIRRSLVDPETVYFPVAIDEEPDEAIKALIEGARELLEEAKLDVKQLVTGEVRSTDDAPFAMIATQIGSVMVRPNARLLESGDSLAVAVNRNHPHFDVISKVYQRDPAMGAYMLARGLLLSEDHVPESDQAMVEMGIEQIKEEFS